MEIHKEYTEINAKTWDAWAQNGCDWSIPVTHEQCLAAREGNWAVYLTPCIAVPRKWFSFEKGKEYWALPAVVGSRCLSFLCWERNVWFLIILTSSFRGNGKSLSGRVTKIRILKGDMTKPLPFQDESFDLIFHPVSNCYVEDILPIWKECYRVLKKGGSLLSGFDNGMNFLFDDDGTLPLTVANRLPFNPLKMDPKVREQMIANGEGIQFSHSLEEEIGGQLKAGFLLKDLYEDRDREGCGILREYTPQYVATWSVKEK